MQWRDLKEFAETKGRRMASVSMGEGEPLVFLHGNPTSSFLWRDIMRPLSSSYRCIAPDLIGMGDSDKLPDSSSARYTFAEHREYLDAWLEQTLPKQPVTFVVHDWGSALGFDWARRHPERVTGIVYMEGIVRPFESWEEFNQDAAPVFQGFP